jgi:parallel beta-helix repeat protein
MKFTSRRHVRRAAAGLALSIPLATLATISSPATASTVPGSCTRYVAPGTPTGDGTTAGKPMSLASLVSFVNAISRPGLVACLAGGSYGAASAQFTLTKGGAAGNPAMIVKDPATTGDAVIAGRLVVARGADNVLISKLSFIGPDAGGPSAFSFDANNVQLIANDFSSPNRICISVGGGIREEAATLPKASGFVADGNKVHDCGTNLAKTGSPQAHAFYVEYSTGAIIRNNIVSNPVGRGVQLFNDADGSRIENNIFDGNFAAVNFGGGTTGSISVDPRSESNIVQNNITTNGVMWCNTNSQCQKALFVQGNHEAANISPPSTDPLTMAGATWGNVVRSNCVYFPDASVAVPYNDSEPGYSYKTTNKSVDPQYNDGTVGDFRLKTTSPCLGKGLRPAIHAVGVSAASTALSGSATVRSPWMTATYRLQARLCSTDTLVTSTAPCSGTWVNSTTGSLIGTDTKVTRQVPGLVSNRVYEYRWVTWQALQPAPSVSVDYSAVSAYWTASAALKVKMLA